jgi:3-isopropylmalate/(R)-2-methylmalate dehydratase small subunit
MGWGIRAVISTSFADIFRNNSLKNGLLPVVVDKQTHQQLFSLAEEEPALRLTIDLRQQTVSLPDGRQVTFPIDAFSKHCLLDGVDQLGYLLNQSSKITAFERANSKLGIQ